LVAWKRWRINKKFISKDQLMKLAGELAKSGYGEYFKRIGGA
jgi:hypothetical protein